jgi:hypothetical protein
LGKKLFFIPAQSTLVAVFFFGAVFFFEAGFFLVAGFFFHNRRTKD